MTEQAGTFELKLTELRCKLRGWPVEHNGVVLCVETPHGDVWVKADGSAYADVEWPADRLLEYRAILTSPRWTIERLLDELPGGWKCSGLVREYGSFRAAMLRFGSRHPVLKTYNALVDLSIVAGLDGKPSIACESTMRTSVGGLDHATLAVADAAVAQLRLILAEIEL